MQVMMQDKTERQVFNRQPARAVLVDMSSPMDRTVCLNVHKALSDLLSLLSHVAGPSRVPFLLLSVLRSFHECVFPLQPVKGNYSRLSSALREIHTFATVLQHQPRGRSHGRFLDAIQEAVAQFRRVSQSLRQGSGVGSNTGACPSQIELTIITALEPREVKQIIEKLADHLDLEHLKKITAICIINPNKLGEQSLSEDIEGYENDRLPSSSQILSSPSELSLSLLDITTSENDVLSILSILKSWLHDCSTDCENLHLAIPPTASLPHRTLLLKCDLHECMIDPTQLTASTKQFTLGTGTSAGIYPNPTASAQTTPMSPQNVPIYKLCSVGMVHMGGVCESVVYGMPLVVRPTACWQLDWEELESNQQNFQALSYLLQDRGQALLACTDPSSLSSVPSISTQPPALGHFLLLPSSSPSTLLIKPVVVSELFLPAGNGSQEMEQLSPDALDLVGSHLDQARRSSISHPRLEVTDMYNPLLVKSGLCEALATLNVTRRGAGPTIRSEASSFAFRPPAKRRTPSHTQVQGCSQRGGRSQGPKRQRSRGFVYGGMID